MKRNHYLSSGPVIQPLMVYSTSSSPAQAALTQNAAEVHVSGPVSNTFTIADLTELGAISEIQAGSEAATITYTCEVK